MASSASGRHLPRKLSVKVKKKSRSCGSSRTHPIPLRTTGARRMKGGVRSEEGGGVRRGETAREHGLIRAMHAHESTKHFKPSVNNATVDEASAEATPEAGTVVGVEEVWGGAAA